jgi:glycosyltransferase involved in cell wall biosynthesis
MDDSITVVIPAYERGQELARALDSLVAQTVKAFDVVVCDDGSKEDLRRVVSRFSSFLPVKYLRIENSGGPGRPRNRAIQDATGSWISFLDSDDWWKPTRVERIAQLLGPDVDVVYHRLEVCQAAGAVSVEKHPAFVGEACGPQPLVRMITRGNPIPNSAAVVRRGLLERLGGITEDHRSVEDFDTWLRAAEAGARFRFHDEALGFYSASEDAISRFSEKQMETQEALFARHLELMPESLKTMARSHFSYLLGSYALRLGNRAQAATYLSRVRFRHAPVRWLKSWVKRAGMRTVERT